MGLSKSVRIKVQRHFQSEQYLIGGQDESPPIGVICNISFIYFTKIHYGFSIFNSNYIYTLG